MNITRLSINRPTLPAVIVIILIFFGVFSYLQLNYELVPRFNPPVLTIATVYPGAPAQTVENDVSIPVEDALSSLENIDVITTTSRENFSLVRLEMKTGTDIDLALQDASRRLQLITDQLPDAARRPILSRFDFNDLPVMRLAVFAHMDTVALTRFVQDKILPGIKQLHGVADVRLTGGVEEQLEINLDPDKLAVEYVSPLQVLKSLAAISREIPAGYLVSDSVRTALNFKGSIDTVTALERLVIYEHPALADKVRLRDVATISVRAREPVVITRLNGKPALGIDIKKQSDANAVELSEEVRNYLQQLEEVYRTDALKFEIAADSSTFTVNATHAVMEDLLLAVLLVSLVMLIFLHSLRNAIIVMIAIPVSIITTFIIMHLLGYSLNLLSLLGLSLAIGILVDDSIVVIENIHRHFSMGKDPVTASYEGRMEIGFTAMSITLIDIVVFVPIILATGMVADLLRQFSVVIVTSTLMSLFVSFTLVPLLTSRWSGKKNSGKGIFSKVGTATDRFMDGIAKGLTNAVSWSLRNKVIVLLVAMALFAGAIYLIPAGYIGVEFTRAGDRSEFLLELELEKSATFRKTAQATSLAETILLRHPEVTTVLSNVGLTSSGRIESNTEYLSEIYVRLVDKSDRGVSTGDFIELIKNELVNGIPGVKIRPIQINIIGLRDDDAVQVSLLHENRDSLRTPALVVEKLLKETEGAVEVRSSLEDVSKEFTYIPHRNKSDALGIDLLQAGYTLRTLVQGNRDFSVNINGTVYPILLIAGNAYRDSISKVDNYQLMNNRGELVPFSEFGSIRETEAATALDRTNRSPSVTIKSQVSGRPAGSVSNDFLKTIKAEQAARDVMLLWGGSSKRTTEALGILGVAFAISIMLVYLVLVALYDSWVYPFAVLFSIPLALIGALSAMAITGQALSIFSIMGLIMMTGLVGKNAILIVDFANRLRGEGNELAAAVTAAVRLRFRPVIMTTLTIVIGLLPVALASGAGSEWKNGLAWALIGGLTSSLILTLIVIPVVYYIIEKLKQKTVGSQRSAVESRK